MIQLEFSRKTKAQQIIIDKTTTRNLDLNYLLTNRLINSANNLNILQIFL